MRYVSNIADFNFYRTAIDKLIEYSEKLAEGIPYLRVDWYDINDKLLFGEMNFYTWGGQCHFEPDSWNDWLGEKIILPDATD